MGGSASKASRAAAKSAADTTRRYPTSQAPRAVKPKATAQAKEPPPTSSSVPSVHPATHVTENRDATANLDASDQDLAVRARVRQLGPVQPNPTMSNSSTVNRPQRAHLPSNQNQPSNFQASTSAPLQSLFPSPSSNPAVTLLLARQKLVEEAAHEIEDVERMGKGRKGRKFLDVGLIRHALVLRDVKGMQLGEIEGRLGLDNGVLARLGGRGVVGVPDDDGAVH